MGRKEGKGGTAHSVREGDRVRRRQAQYGERADRRQKVVP